MAYCGVAWRGAAWRGLLSKQPQYHPHRNAPVTSPNIPPPALTRALRPAGGTWPLLWLTDMRPSPSRFSVREFIHSCICPTCAEHLAHGQAERGPVLYTNRRQLNRGDGAVACAAVLRCMGLWRCVHDAPRRNTRARGPSRASIAEHEQEETWRNVDTARRSRIEAWPVAGNLPELPHRAPRPARPSR